MPPELLTLLSTLAGGGLAVVGGLIGAWWTTRHAALDRQHRACQEMLRLTRRLLMALCTEEDRYQEQDWAQDAEYLATGEQDRGALIAATVEYTERYEAAEAAVDHLADELAILALDLRRRTDRDAVKVCVDAIYERTSLPPPPARIGRRATWVIEKMIEVSLNRRAWCQASGLGSEDNKTLKYLAGEVSEIKAQRAESFRDQKRADEEWARQQRERRESEALDSEGDRTS
ncbi:MAG: hypothetical protein ACRDRL_30090 [Sciscionella sp.]